MSLQPGNATQIAARLRALADYGASKQAPADSVLVQGVGAARAYADYLEQDLGPELAGVVIRPGSSVYATADALAQLITDEGVNYGDGSPPPAAEASSLRWLPAVAAGVAAGGLFYAYRRGWL